MSNETHIREVTKKVRLIDANALKDDFRRYMADRYDGERCVSEENCITCGRVCLFQRTINNAPTVDAVEVVRGKDCKHCKKYTNRFDPTAKEHMLCKRIYDFAYGVEADDFCSYGERREGE